MAPLREESEYPLHISAAATAKRMTDPILPDSKRKATEEPSTPSAHKRIKSSHSDSPEPKKIEPIPFPEKVSLYI